MQRTPKQLETLMLIKMEQAQRWERIEQMVRNKIEAIYTEIDRLNSELYDTNLEELSENIPGHE